MLLGGYEASPTSGYREHNSVASRISTPYQVHGDRLAWEGSDPIAEILI